MILTSRHVYSLILPCIIALFVHSSSSLSVASSRGNGTSRDSTKDDLRLKVRDGRMSSFHFQPSEGTRKRGTGGSVGPSYAINCYYCNIFLGGGEGSSGGGGGLPSWDGDDGDVTSKAIDVHNSLRAKHGTGGLTSNGTLISGAQNWANRLLNGASGHSGTPGVGENIYWKVSSNAASDDDVVNEGVQWWYNEINNYDWNNPGESRNGMTIDHFTQVVWVATQQIGCAISSGPYNGGSWQGTQYNLVCQYYPQGNYYYNGRKAQAYRDNVLPPS